MSREQALRSYTLDAAYAAFEENQKGSLESGKFADITVLSRDIMTIPLPEILDTEVVYTVIGGEVVYGRP
jgi:predicted amidohydrolase YtcJ